MCGFNRNLDNFRQSLKIAKLEKITQKRNKLRQNRQKTRKNK